MIRQFLTVLFFTTVYAVVRYAGFANVSPIHIPVYLLNKGISMTAAYSLLMASTRPDPRPARGLRFLEKGLHEPGLHSRPLVARHPQQGVFPQILRRRHDEPDGRDSRSFWALWGSTVSGAC